MSASVGSPPENPWATFGQRRFQRLECPLISSYGIQNKGRLNAKFISRFETIVPARIANTPKACFP
jgi:hypothetical protein